MFWLSDEAIEYAVFKCQNNPGYKVGIALNSRSKYNDVELCMRKCLKDTDDYIFRKRANDKRIEFHNGSYIRIIPATDNSRGYRFHLLIADREISNEIINYILRPCETLNDVVDRHELADEEGEVLALVEVKDLINRQNAEIKKLKNATQKQGQFLFEERAQKYDLIDMLSQVKSESYKEFAEKVKQKCYETYDEVLPSLFSEIVDEVLMKMVNKDNLA